MGSIGEPIHGHWVPGSALHACIVHVQYVAWIKQVMGDGDGLMDVGHVHACNIWKTGNMSHALSWQYMGNAWLMWAMHGCSQQHQNPAPPKQTRNHTNNWVCYSITNNCLLNCACCGVDPHMNKKLNIIRDARKAGP